MAPGNAGQKGGGLLYKEGWIHCPAAETLLENKFLCFEKLQPYAELVTLFWFQGTFHLCQDKLVSLIPTAFIKAFHIIGNGQAEIFLVGKNDNL